MATYAFSKTGAEIAINTYTDATPSGYVLAVDPFNNKVIISHPQGLIRAEVDTDDDTITVNEEEFTGTAGELKALLISDIFQVTGASGSEEITVYSLSTDITNAQIKGLPNAYVTVVPAPGAGNIIMFHRALLSWDLSGGTYTNVDTQESVSLAYGEWDCDASSPIFLPSTASTHWQFLSPRLQDATSTLGASYSQQNFDASYGSTSGGIILPNSPLKVVMVNGALGDLTGGHADNTLKVTVYYSVVAV